MKRDKNEQSSLLALAMRRHLRTAEKDCRPPGTIRRAITTLNIRDRTGSLRVRLGIRRGQYLVQPGVYAAGNPDPSSPVFVSANYKLSFDHLRRSLEKTDSWILVLDTDGINVWCSAGKGTFGTEELVKRIGETRLSEIVDHRELILPQLSAPGVSAHLVKEQSGFSVTYGPVRARDIPAFMAAGKKADAGMRAVRFNTWDRAVLAPVEVACWSKQALLVAIVIALSAGFYSYRYHPGCVAGDGLYWAGLFLLAYILGAVLVPILLPWLPGRAFALKGGLTGMVLGAGILYIGKGGWCTATPWMPSLGWLLIVIATASFTAMNFTGSSTYTSLSGVRKEMRTAVPAQAVAIILGMILWVAGRLTIEGLS